MKANWKRAAVTWTSVFVLGVIPVQAADQTAGFGGTKVLIAFDPYDGKEGAHEKFRAALNEANVKILKNYHYGFYLLLDCGRRKPEEVLKGVPFHAGAIVFRDGKFLNAISSHDKRRIPSKFAVIHWGSTKKAIQQMEKDIAKFSRMEGVVAEKISAAPGRENAIMGNPWHLRLTPGKGKTLIEVFLMTEAQFDYTKLGAPIGTRNKNGRIG